MYEKFSTLACLKKFIEAERKAACVNSQICDYYYWPAVRFGLFYDFIMPSVTGIWAGHPDGTAKYRIPRSSVFKRYLCGGFKKKIVSWFKFNADLHFRKYQFLFSLEPRMMHCGDRGVVPIMLDFIIDSMPDSAAVLQYSSGKCFVDMPDRYHVFRPSASRLRKIYCKRLVRSSKVAKRIFDEINRIVPYFDDAFGVSIDRDRLHAYITGQMINYKIYLPIFKRYIKRLGVKCVVTSCHYHPHNLTLCEAAHELGLDVVELQHGRVSSEHVAYNLAERELTMAPDYVFTWGDYWNSYFCNYANKGLIATGYPFIEWARRKYGGVSNVRKVVLFISESGAGNELSKMAFRAVNELPTDRYVVKYKPHPSETHSWKSLYPYLIDSSVIVVDNATTNIYAELAQASFVIGASSTALIEGLIWGAKTLIVRDLPYSDVLSEYVEAGFCRWIDSDCHLLDCLDCDNIDHKSVDVSRLFAPEALNRTVEALQTIVTQSI